MKLGSHLIILTLGKSLITVLYCCLVLFRHKEVNVYPDDSEKPPEGEGLNRRAEITLDRVWPVDKSTGEYITDPERSAVLRYEERLARAAHRNQAKFIEYRPETGSWVFRVNHFSKYGLDDSDEECELPAAPPKTANLPTAQGQAAQTTTTGAGLGLGGFSSTIAQTTSMSLTFEEGMGVEDDLVIPRCVYEFDDSVRVQSPPPVSTQLAKTLGMPSQQVQIMKASTSTDNDYIQDVSMGVGSFLDQSVRSSLAPRKEMSRVFKDSPAHSPVSLFKSSAIAGIQQPGAGLNRSYVPMDQSFSSTANLQQSTEMENLSTYVRLEHVRNPEQCRKVVPRFATAEIPLSQTTSTKTPEKTLTPFKIFSHKVWDEVKATNQELKLKEIDKIVHQMWCNLSDEEKQEFVEQYENDKIEYELAVRAAQVIQRTETPEESCAKTGDSKKRKFIDSSSVFEEEERQAELMREHEAAVEPHDASSAKDESQKEAIVSEAAPLEMNLEQSDQLMREREAASAVADLQAEKEANIFEFYESLALKGVGIQIRGNFHWMDFDGF